LLTNGYHRLFSTLVLHGNPMALVWHLLVLYLFGTEQERLFGHVRFALIYIGGALGGATAAVALGLAAPQNLYSVGAGFGVVAMLSAELVYLYNHRQLMRAKVRERGWRVGVFLLVTVVLQAVLGVHDSATLWPAGSWWPRVAVFGAVGGGAVLAAYLAPRFGLIKDMNQSGFRAQDINPLRSGRVVNVLSLYATALLLVLLAVAWGGRG
jgi:membrane associated rhomboid family serine protease